MTDNRTINKWTFVVTLVGAAVSAAALVLLLPSLFADTDHPGTVVYVLLGALTAILGVAARWMRGRSGLSTRTG